VPFGFEAWDFIPPLLVLLSVPLTDFFEWDLDFGLLLESPSAWLLAWCCPSATILFLEFFAPEEIPFWSFLESERPVFLLFE